MKNFSIINTLSHNILFPLLVSLLFFQLLTYPQTEHLLVYDTRTKKIDTLKTILPTGHKSYGHTSWYIGSDNGFSFLDTLKPAKPFNNSGFTDFKPAHLFYPVNNFPLRTAIKLFVMRNDTLRQKCSGIIVGKNLILTASHCACSRDTITGGSVFNDSLYVAPSYDNGRMNALYSKVKVIKTYIPISNLKSWLAKDIALIKTEEPIGLITGWVGIGFDEDDNFYKENVFQKFSYPGIRDLYDSTRIYNGDTLYYNYGLLDIVESDMFGYDIYGIPGQSGSSLIYTNNEQFFSVGVLNFASFSAHHRIRKDIYYPFKEIIEEENSLLQNSYENVIDFNLLNAYPNPFNSSTNIIYWLKKGSSVNLTVYNNLGQEVMVLVNKFQEAGKYRINFNLANSSSGVYFYKLFVNGYSKTGKVVYLK